MGAWNRSKLTDRPALNDNTGKPINVEALGLNNPYGSPVSLLAMSPPVQGNVRLRKEFTLGAYGGFLQGAALWRGHEFSTTDGLSQKNDLAHTPYAQRIDQYYVTRPRTIMLKVNYKFRGQQAASGTAPKRRRRALMAGGAAFLGVPKRPYA